MREIRLRQPHTDRSTGITHQPGEVILVEDEVAEWLVNLYVEQSINNNTESERVQSEIADLVTKKRRK